MIIYDKGTVFNSDAAAIVNTVNCVGFMGAGIALEFSLRYPKMLKDYESKCRNSLIRTGKVDYYENDGKTIINFPTKWHFKYPSKIEWIEQGLIDFVSTYKTKNITSVAFPKLGTSNGGLIWDDVKLLMEKYLSNLDIPVYICLDMDEAKGLEKQMLDVFNSLDLNSLKKYMRINEKQRNIIENSRPIKRFWMIKNLEGVGATFYTKIFNYCKNSIEPGENFGSQISMFDEP